MAAREVYPTQTDTGRKMTGVSEFTLKLDPRNLGVLLRRKLDYSFPNQRAEVYVAVPAPPPAPPKRGKAKRGAPAKPAKPASVQMIWKPVGVWYLAGSNTCVYSNPKGEMDRALHVVQTSNRRFRDDEFLLPIALTKGRSAIRIQIRFTPVRRPLFPGGPTGESAWSEFRYSAYCYRLPVS